MSLQSPRWSVFESRHAGPRVGNPFDDVEFKAVFRQGNRYIPVSGFYDGEGIYVLRFMPDSEGEWSFVSESNAPELDGLSATFLCVAAEEGAHGLVRVARRFHFAYDDGVFYRPFGTTAYAWTSQDPELEERTLDSLARSPFNKIRMCVFPKHYDYNENEPPLYAFESIAPENAAEGNRDAGSERRWDFARFDPSFFRHLEKRIAELCALGIEADLILFHPYDRWGFAGMGREADERYLRYLVARIAAFRNIWWSMANEYDLMPWKPIADWDNLFRVLQSADPYGHLRSIHNCRSFYDHGKPWITHCSIQHNDVSLATEWRELYGKPVVIDECRYEGNLPRRWGNITGQEMANRIWEGFARGAYVGHGETFLAPKDEIWWAKGGSLRGESVARIAFLREILEEGPTLGLDTARLGPNAHAVSGTAEASFLVFYGMAQPAYQTLELPDGAFAIDIIDAWNMTVTRAPGLYSGSCRVALPGTILIALRITRQA
jgi:hypothetical protein